MKTVWGIFLFTGLTLPSVLPMEVTTEDSCYRNFAGSWMKCHGTLPNFANESFAQLSKVEQLDVVQCHFNEVSKRAFQGMIGLRTILINCNNSVKPLVFADDALEGLDRLLLLSANQNNIRQLPSSFICRANSVQHVFLWRNSLKSVDDLGLYTHCNDSAMTQSCGQAIQTLVLSQNAIERLPDFMMCGLQNLTRLDLSQNRISGIDPQAFFHLESLRELDLSANNITLLSEDVGKRLKNLLILSLSHNPQLGNVTDIFKNTNRLERLNMTNTGSAMRDWLAEESSRFRRNLIILVLDQNGISELNGSIFEPGGPKWPPVGTKVELNCMNRANLYSYISSTLYNPIMAQGDSVHYLSEGAFDSGITGLRNLLLDDNEFDEFPSALKVLRNVQMLSMRRNRLQTLDDDQFEALAYLHLLYLSFNGIQNISGNVFSTLQCLLRVHLDHNAISTVNSTAFDNNPDLEEVFLQNNMISSIDGLFRHNQELRTLDLSHNLLTVVAIDSLPLSLVSLNLSHNRLTVIYETAFPVHLGMTMLDLSHNQLTYVDKDAFPVSVVELNLNDNQISGMGNCTFCAMGRMNRLHMENNRLRTAKPEWFMVNARKLGSVAYVHLQGNDFVCDCTIKTFTGAILANVLGNARIVDVHDLPCRPEFFKGHQESVSIFSTSSPEDFLCRSNHTLNATLPGKCNFYHDLAWDLVIGDCTSANLTSVPDTVPSNVMALYLDGNDLGWITGSDFRRTPHIQRLLMNNSRILGVEEGAFEPMTNLRILHLEHNFLHVIGGQTFRGLPKLLELYLFANRLEMVEDEAFQPLTSLQLLHINQNQLTTFPVWELAHLQHLTHIRLSENPWSCECDYLQSYREWLQNSASKVQDVKTLFCNYGDNSTSATPLIAYDGANCFGSLNFLNSKYFPLTTSLSALALFLFVASAILFTYREEIRVIVYYRYGLRLFSKNSEPDSDQNKIYDAFVCYSHDDEAFVSEQLMPGLENVEPPFRLCVHSRDFIIGSFITDNILEAVEKSRRTILILSEHFIQSEWCRFEFKTAHLQMFRDPSHRVILIVRGVVPKNLHPEMKVYLKTNTYLMWDDRLFWKRLYYAMPDRKAAITS